MLLKNRCLKYRFRNEIKKTCFQSHWRKHLQGKKALILKIEEKDGKEKKKSTVFPSCPNHTQTQEGYKCHSWKNAPQTSAFIHFEFFLANDKRLSSLASLLFTFCLHYTFKHLSKLTKVVCIHAQLENILNLFKPEMHYQKCINIVHY